MKKMLFPILLILVALLVSAVNADEYKGIFISGDSIYYDCPSGQLPTPEEFNVDIKSVNIINDRFFTDKNNVYNMAVTSKFETCNWNILTNADPATFIFLNDYYQKDKNNVYKSDNYWGWGTSKVIENADSESFHLLGEHYAKDKNNVYFATFQSLNTVTEADLDTFEILSEDPYYGLDKNNMYYQGKILSDAGEKITNYSLYKNLKGKIILKVEENGEAYYVHPSKQEMHFLSRPVVAFYVMREQGVGITNSDLDKIPVADNYCPDYTPNCDKANSHNMNFTNSHKGKIFLQIEGNGEAWYVNPNDSKRYFLGRPTDAFNIMRNLGLGISSNNFDSLIN